MSKIAASFCLACLLVSCNRGLVHPPILEEYASLNLALDAFRDAVGLVPRTGTTADIREHFVKLGISAELDEALLGSGLAPELLDDDELVLLLLCGVPNKEQRGEDAWMPIGELAPGEFSRYYHVFFVPKPGWVKDTDRDGWPEYVIPGSGPVRFSATSFQLLPPADNDGA